MTDSNLNIARNLMDTNKPILLFLVVSIFLIGGCASYIPSEFHTEHSRSIMGKDVIPFKINSLSLDIWPMWGVAGPTDKEKQAMREIKESIGILSPLGDIKEKFVQSLSGSIVAGEFLSLNSPNVDVMKVDGWVGFTDSTFLLSWEGIYVFEYSMHANIYYGSGQMNSDGEEIMESVWVGNCGYRPSFSFLPEGGSLNYWLANDGLELKNILSEISERCGKSLAKKLLEHLGH